MHPATVERDLLANVNRFSSFTAHELANPLSALRMAVHLLQHTPTESGRRELLDRCRRLIDQMASITEDLRALGASQHPHREAVNLTAWLGDLTRQLDAPGNIRLVLPSTNPQEHCVYLAPRLMAHAVTNLIRNAAEAMTNEGTIGLEVQVQPGGLRLTVWDTGPGVPQDKIPALFRDAFTTKSRGSGLGLLIVSTVVEQVHGGKVSYSPNCPHGARFHIDLPAALTPCPLALTCAPCPPEQ